MPNIRQTLLIAASAEVVYNAITTSTGLSSWWTPNVHAVPEINSVASFPFGNGYVKEMQIQKLIPQDLVQWKCIQGDEEWIGTVITFNLFEKSNDALFESQPELKGQIEQNIADKATTLIFQHDDWVDYTATFAECSYTWAQFLRSLKAFCETGKGRPWPTQHSIT